MPTMLPLLPISLLLLWSPITQAGIFDDIGCAWDKAVTGGNCLIQFNVDMARYPGEGRCCILAKFVFCASQSSPGCPMDPEQLVQRLGQSLRGCEETMISSFECLYFFYPVVVTFIALFLTTLTCLCCIQCCKGKSSSGNRRNVNQRQPAQVYAMRQEPYNPSVVYQETSRPLVYVAPSAPTVTSGVNSQSLLPPSYEEVLRKY